MELIQPDTITPELYNPQSLNRYSYTFNNPLRYTDPTGHMADDESDGAGCSGGGPACIMNMWSGYDNADYMMASLRNWVRYHKDYNIQADSRLSDEEKVFVVTAAFQAAVEDKAPVAEVAAAGGLLSFFSIIVGGVNMSPDDSGGGGGFGSHHSETKWKNQMASRGWTMEQIYEAVEFGRSASVKNSIHPGNPATLYYHPVTGRAVVIDNVTNEILHIGGDNYNYSDWLLK